MVYFPRKSKDQTGYQHTPILLTTLCEVFFKELRLGSIRSEATRNLIDDLTSSSGWTPSSLCKSAGVNWWGLGSPTWRSQNASGFARAVSCGMKKQWEFNRHRHKAHRHSPKYRYYCWNRSIFKAFFPAFGPWLGFRLVPNLMPIFLAVSESALLVQRHCLI